MKITETIERECCNWNRDFVVTASKIGGHNIKVCKHCGQLWIWDRQPGDMDSTYHKVTITDYKIQ